MFLLRCAFWLSIVYASMSWGGVALQRHGSFEAATLGAAEPGDESLIGKAAEGLGGFCRGREMDCVRDAAMLTALVRKTLRNDDGADASPTEAVLSEAAVEDLIVGGAAETPTPVRDPRRRAAGRVLTRLP